MTSRVSDDMLLLLVMCMWLSQRWKQCPSGNWIPSTKAAGASVSRGLLISQMEGGGGMPWSTSIYVQLEEPSRLLYVGINRLAFGTDNRSLAIDIDRQADRWTGDLSEGSYWSVNRNTQSRWIWIESQCWGGLEVQFKTGKKNLYYENIPVI